MIRAATPAPAASASPTSMAIRPTGRPDELPSGVTTMPVVAGAVGVWVWWAPELLLLDEEPMPVGPGRGTEPEPELATGTAETSADLALSWTPSTRATLK